MTSHELQFKAILKEETSISLTE